MDTTLKLRLARTLPRRSMQAIVRWLRECRHDWGIKACNGYGSASEEQCIKCGEYRHRIHDHRIMGREEWKTGRHPKSSKV
jgi:hypothetical protein